MSRASYKLRAILQPLHWAFSQVPENLYNSMIFTLDFELLHDKG